MIGWFVRTQSVDTLLPESSGGLLVNSHPMSNLSYSLGLDWYCSLHSSSAYQRKRSWVIPTMMISFLATQAHMFSPIWKDPEAALLMFCFSGWLVGYLCSYPLLKVRWLFNLTYFSGANKNTKLLKFGKFPPDCWWNPTLIVSRSTAWQSSHWRFPSTLLQIAEVAKCLSCWLIIHHSESFSLSWSSVGSWTLFRTMVEL